MPIGWSRPLRYALLAALAAAGLTCDDVTFEPGLEVHSALNLAAFAPDVQIVPFPAESLIIELRRMSDSSVAVRRVFATDLIEIEGDSAVVEFSITLSTNPESFYLDARVTGDGLTWLQVSDVITVDAGNGTSVEELAPVYVGPGADATALLISLADTTITGGDSLLVTGTVFEGQSVAPNAPVGFEISDSSTVSEPRYLEPNQAWIYAPRAITGQVMVTAVALTRNGSLRAEGTLGFFARADLIELVSGNNQMLQLGQTAQQPLVVRVRDAAGNPYTRGYPVDFALPAGPVGSVVTPPTVVTDASGLAQTTLSVGDVPGGITVTATAQDLGGSPITFNASALSGVGPEMVIWAGDAQTVTVGTAVPIAPAVIVTNQSGDPAPDVPVTFSVVAGGGSVQGASVLTDAGGVATAGSWTLGTGVGVNTLTASSSGVPDVLFRGTAVADAPSALVPVAGDDQSANAGAPLANPLIVEMHDQYGNIVPDVDVTWQALHGIVSPMTTTTDASGRAQTSWTLGVNAQMQTATASAVGTDPALFMATAIFPNPTILMALVGTNRIPVGMAENLDVTLTAPAPTGGIVVTFSSDDPSVAQVQQGSVDILEGEFNAQVGIMGGANAGNTTVRASAPGYDDGALSVTVSLQVLSIPAAVNVPFGGSTSIPVQISDLAGPGGEVVTLVSDNPTVVAVTTPLVTIGVGQTTVNGTLAGLLPGVANITATSVSFGGAAGTAATTANLNIVATSVQANESFGDDITIRLESGGIPIAAPAGGIVVTLTPVDATCAAVTSPVTIPAGLINATATVTYGGSATTPCATVITATAPNVTQDQINVNVIPAPPVNLTGVAVGAGLQRAWSGSLGVSNHGGVTVTVTSADPQSVLVSPNASTIGTPSLQVVVPDGQATFSYFVQGVEGQVGPTTITADAPGFSDGVATITVEQPGVQLIGVAAATTTLTIDDAFYARVGIVSGTGVSPVLDVRAGGSELTVDITSSVPAVGRLVNLAGAQGGATTVTIPVGQSNSPTTVAAGGVALEPLTEGQTTVAASIAGFVQTATATQVVDVSQPAINLSDPVVGAGLQRGWSGSLGATDHGGVTVTLTSGTPSVFLLSPDAVTPGTASIEVSVPNGQATYSFYVQGVEDQPGVSTLTVTAAGFADGTATGTVAQPGVQLVGLSAATTTLTPDDAFYARVGLVSGNGVSPVLEVRAGGNDLTVDITSGTPAAGQLVKSSGPQGGATTVSILVGQSNSPTAVATGGVALQPLSEGQTTVSASIPGFVSTVTAMQVVDVSQPGINLSDVTVPAALQRAWSGSLGASGHGGVMVTLTSGNPGLLLLAPDAITAGLAAINIFVPNGQTSFGFYVQGVEGQQNVTSIMVTAAGFADGTATATVIQPGVQLVGLSTSTTTLSADDEFYARVGVPSGSGVNPALAVRAGGSDLMVDITSSAPTVGRLVTSAGPQGAVTTVTIPVGAVNTPTNVAAGGVALEPLTDGQTTVVAAIPGFIGTTGATQAVDVAQPGINISDAVVGAGFQRAWSATLGAPNHGGVDVTLTSSNPSIFLLSPNATTAGQASIDIVVPNGQTSLTFYVQGVEGQEDVTTVIATAFGFTDGSATVSVEPPAIRIVGLNPTQVVSGGNDDFYVQVGLLSGTGINPALQIRAGAPNPLTVAITSGTPSVAQLMNATQNGDVLNVQIAIGQSNSPTSVAAGGISLDPLAVGQTIVTATAPGYVSPQQATVAVNVNL